MKLRHLIAFLCLLIGIASLAAVAYLTWRNIAHGDCMILWVYLVLVLAGIPLAITWWKDLVATEWTAIVSFILAASLVAVGFAFYVGFNEHDNPWHVFAPEEVRPHAPSLTLEDYLKNKPPDKPLWVRIATALFLLSSSPIIAPYIYKGSLFCLRSLRRRRIPAAISQ